jgi:AbrB family looped-hinge helix DNA binding protein
MVRKFKDKKFYGSTIIGGKGQVVIPKEAREDLKLKKGDKLLVFGMGDMIALMKFSNLKKFMEYLEKHLKSLKEIIKKEK